MDTTQEAVTILAHLDTDGDGIVTATEFGDFLIHHSSQSLVASNRRVQDSMGQDARVVLDVKVVPGSNQDSMDRLKAAGYEALPEDLNQGNRGGALWLFVLRGKAGDIGVDAADQAAAAVTDIVIARTAKDAVLTADGFEVVGECHLNHGTWTGAKDRLWVRRNPQDRNPIVHLHVSVGATGPPSRGYKRVNGTLNAGMTRP